MSVWEIRYFSVVCPYPRLTLLSVSALLRQPLYQRCDRLRPALFRLASDTGDDNEALTRILAANDELTLVLSAFKEQLDRRRRHCGGERTQPPDPLSSGSPLFAASAGPGQVKSYHLMDFSALDSAQAPLLDLNDPGWPSFAYPGFCLDSNDGTL